VSESAERIARQHFDEKWPPRTAPISARSTYARAPGEPFAVTPIRGCNGVMDLGDKRIMEYASPRAKSPKTSPARSQRFREGSFHGVFVASGLEPTETELTMRAAA